MEEFLIAANKNRFAWLTLSEISWNQQEGVTALSTENGIKLIFGKEGFAGKLDKWELFYSQVAARKGTDQFHTVDLRFEDQIDRKSTRLNSSHVAISYAVFCLKKKIINQVRNTY